MESVALPDVTLLPKRRRRIILFGPHDRFNFGDLLFEKIVSKLLVTHRNYADSDLIRAGLFDVNMSNFGGHHSIASIHRVREASRRDGGYHIIYLGGECLRCSFECGVSMLPDVASQSAARQHQVSDCAYLLPKKDLMPANRIPPIVAVANSVGGNFNFKESPPDCRISVETADFVTFRDMKLNTTHRYIPLAQSRPDSAILTSLLFDRTIAQYGSIGQMQQLRNGTGYLAIQFKVADSYEENSGKIAQVLDRIYKMTNLTTVFFQAGSVPRHDSLALYEQVSRQMTTPNFIFTTTHLWAIVALIRYSSAVISTSLHVRIMAFVHARPRVTMCDPSYKHGFFISLWESEDATKCIDRLWNANAVTRALKTSMATSPNKTYAALQRAIDSYMSGFEEWSSLFDKADQIQ